MPRARSSYTSDWQTAASEQGSGCLSGFLIPPLAVLLVGVLLAFFVKGLNIPVQAAALPQATTVLANQDSPLLPLPLQIVGLAVDIASAEKPAAASQSTSLSPIFTPEIQYWADSIIRWAAASNLDPNLAATVMQIESCGDPRATSRAGAMGLFQVMPYHFTAGENPYAPDTNALRGLGYLKRSLDAAGGNARLALAGYNGGIGVTTSASLNEWYGRYGAGLCRQAAQRLGLP